MMYYIVYFPVSIVAFIVLMLCYYYMLKTAIKVTRAIYPIEQNTETANSISVKQLKITVSLGLVIFAYLLAYIPFMIGNFVINSVSPVSENDRLIGLIGHVLWQTNIWINPIIYTKHQPDFRLAFKALITCQNKI